MRERGSGKVLAMKKLRKSEMLRRGQVSSEGWCVVWVVALGEGDALADDDGGGRASGARCFGRAPLQSRRTKHKNTQQH